MRGSVALARRARVSPMLVAATVVAFGTSLPELVVALRAALTGYPGIVFGNVVGSNIANILLVGGATALIYPLAAGGKVARRDSAIMLGVTVVFSAFCLTLPLHRAVGIALLAGLAGVCVMAALDAARDRSATVDTPLDWVLGLPNTLWMIAVFITLGAIGLPLGADLIVDGAVVISESWGVSDTVIGLSLLAFSTSLPELATAVVAAQQKRTEVAVGTLIGSNLLNILAIMGVSAAVSPRPIPVPDSFATLDLPVLLVGAVALTAFVWLEKPVGRAPAVIMVGGYVAYIGALFLRG